MTTTTLTPPALAPPYAGQRIVRWAGYLTAFLGAAHMITALALTAPEHAGTWLSQGIWGEHLATMSSANGAYWLTFGSFGPLQVVLGLLVLWMDRRGLVPPAYVAWTLIANGLLCGLIFGPAPWPVDLVSGALLLVGARRAQQGVAGA